MANLLENDLQALVTKFAEGSIKQPNAVDPFAPITDDNGSSQVPPVVTPATDTVPAVVPVTSAAAEPVIVKVEDDLINDWDGVPTTPVVPVEPVTPTPSKPDFSLIAKALGKEEILGQEDVVKEIEAINRTAEVVKSAPEELVKAMEIAKLGGDYLEYLKVSSVDWGKEDPTVLYENYVEDQFYDPNTNLVDYEKVDKFLEKLDDEEKEFRGKELQRNYIAHQRQQQAIMKQAAEQKKAHFEHSVRDAVSTLKDVNGFVLTPAKKAELLEYVLKGEDLRESDVQTRVVNAFIKKNFQAIDSYLKTKIKNTVTRDILTEAQVTSIKPSTEKVESLSTKPFGVAEYIQELKKQRGL